MSATVTSSPHYQVSTEPGQHDGLTADQLTEIDVEFIVALGNLVKPGTDPKTIIPALASRLRYFPPEHIALALDRSRATGGLARLVSLYKDEHPPVVTDALDRCYHR